MGWLVTPSPVQLHHQQAGWPKWHRGSQRNELSAYLLFYMNSWSHLLRALSRFSRISGRSPFLTELLTNRSPVGVLMKSSEERLCMHTHTHTNNTGINDLHNNDVLKYSFEPSLNDVNKVTPGGWTDTQDTHGRARPRARPCPWAHPRALCLTPVSPLGLSAAV